MTPLLQRKVISWTCEEGKSTNDVTLTSLCVCLPLSPCVLLPSAPFSWTGSQVYDVKLFPVEPVELMAGDTLTLNCTALVEFNTGLEIQWSYPGKQVHTGNTLDKRRLEFMDIQIF